MASRGCDRCEHTKREHNIHVTQREPAVPNRLCSAPVGNRLCLCPRYIKPGTMR